MGKGENFMPKISVIVPIYNSVRFIRECVDSIVGQTCKDMEILLVDAGSTDGTVEILQEYCKKDPRIQLLHSDKKSMGYQYNLGIAQATGKYVGFVESDDYIAPTMYEKLLAAMENNEIDYVKADYDLFVSRDEQVFLRHNLLPIAMENMYQKRVTPKEFPELLLSDIYMWNGLYNIDFIRRNKILLNETPKAEYQDIGFVLQTFCMADNIMYIRDESYKYRKDNFGASNYDSKAIEYGAQELEYIQTKLRAEHFNDKSLVGWLCWKFWGLFYSYYERAALSSTDFQEIRAYSERFCKAFLSLYRKIPYTYANLFNFEAAFQPFLSGAVLEKGYLKLIIGQRQRMLNLWEYAKSYKKVVIFGAGKMGRCWCGILRNNGFPGNIVFCDNSRAKWGTVIMGREVVPPDEAIGYGAGTLYLIANEAHWKDIHRQLLDGNVEENDICRILPVSALNAFEIYFQDVCQEDSASNGERKEKE